MPHVLETPAHDPALVRLFKGSRKSYEENVDALIAKLDEAAAHTRAARDKSSGAAATPPARKLAAVSVVRKVSPAPAKTSRKAGASPQ